MSIETTFECDGLAEDLQVINVRGQEKISELYTFNIEARIPVVAAEGLDEEEAIASAARVIFDTDDGEFTYNGIVSAMEEVRVAQGYVVFSFELVPQIWALGLTRRNRVFKDENIIDIITTVLTDADLVEGEADDFFISSDVDVDNLPVPDFVCQFNETDLNFIMRLLEKEGLFFYFTQSDEQETMVIDDGLIDNDIDHGDVDYDPNASTIGGLHSWVCKRNLLNSKTIVRDYNYRSADVPIREEYGGEGADELPFSSNVDFAEHTLSATNAERYAELRSEEITCREVRFLGECSILPFSAGQTFSIGDGPRSKYNGEQYLITEISIEVTTPAAGSTENIRGGFNEEGHKIMHGDGPEGRPEVWIEFVAIPSNVQFRPQRMTSKPRIHGPVTAFVYASNGEGYCDVDEMGRYLVRLPFVDTEEEVLEDITHWIRMAQPYAGLEEGAYFPLKHNTEVILTFINGDPDRPVIQSALPNSETPSLLHAAKEGEHSTAHLATIATSGAFNLFAKSGWYKRIEMKDFITNKGEEFEEHYFTEMSIDNSGGSIVATAGNELTLEDEQSGRFYINRIYGDQYTWVDGINYEWDNKPSYCFGNGYDEIHENDDMTILQSEKFDIPYLPDGKMDMEDGFIEKVWGDKFEYFEGRTYAWSGGPGPGGSTQTFSYGNGYTENLIAGLPQEGTIFEGNRPAGVEVGSHWDDYTDSEFGFDPAFGTIEITHGDTYSYQDGVSIDVKEGDSYSRQYGGHINEKSNIDSSTSVTTVTGDVTETMNGMNVTSTTTLTGAQTETTTVAGAVTSTTTVAGAVTDTTTIAGVLTETQTVAGVITSTTTAPLMNSITLGNSVNVTTGATADVVAGASTSANCGPTASAYLGADAGAWLGVSAEAKLAASIAVFIGFSADIALAGKFAMTIGANLDMTIGVKLDNKTGGGLEFTSFKVQA